MNIFPEKRVNCTPTFVSFVEIFIYDEVFSRKNSNSIARIIFRFRYNFAEIFIYDKVFSQKKLSQLRENFRFRYSFALLQIQLLPIGIYGTVVVVGIDGGRRR